MRIQLVIGTFEALFMILLIISMPLLTCCMYCK